MRDTELAFTGPATFFKAPYRPLDGSWRADIALLGVPYDSAVGYRPGARFAPNALRLASGRFALGPGGFYDLARNSQRLVGVSHVDAGDVDPVQLETEASFERITAAAGALRQRVGLPLFVGGDHSVSFPLLRAYHDVEDLHVVQIDAHLDYSHERNGTRWSNSSPFRRAVEALPGLGRIAVIGLRGLRADREAVERARARGHALVSAETVRTDFAAAVAALPVGKRVYLSFDIDALDPGVAPGTSSPEVEGLSYAEAIGLVSRVIGSNTLIGFDLTEIAPNLDASGRTALLGARLLAETMALWWENRSETD